VLAGGRQVAGAGKHAASLRFAKNVPFTAAHAGDATGWADVGWPVAHAAAVAWQAVKTGGRSPSCHWTPACAREQASHR
jgi:hypothetical protein